MNIAAVSRLVLPLGLLLLLFCSTGFAIRCYQCDWNSGNCTTIVTCSREDGCMKVTNLITRDIKYACRSYDTCNTKTIKSELALSSIELKCCTSNLCNKGLADIPAAGLILSLATVLLTVFF